MRNIFLVRGSEKTMENWSSEKLARSPSLLPLTFQLENNQNYSTEQCYNAEERKA